MTKERRVVITGIGPLASTGIGKDAFWEGILNKRVGLKLEEVKIDGEIWDKFYLHKVQDFDINKFGISQDLLDDLKIWKEGEEITDLYFLIAAIKLALNDSNLKYDNDNNIGLILTHENPGLEQFFYKVCNDAFELKQEQTRYDSRIKRKQFFEDLYKKEVKTAYDLQTFMYLFHVSKIFNIHGYSLFINNACASGLYALEAASQSIKSGKSSVVIIAGADYPRIYKYFWFKQLGMYAEDGKIKPFCKDANGLVFGDGGISLILEDLDHALKRGSHIYAEYLGGGFLQEGWKVTIPFIGSDFYQKAIIQAIGTSNIKKEDIDLICAHGVGNPVIDGYEAKAITNEFNTISKKPLITAFKPYVGHTLGASALLETAILIFCLGNNLIVPLLNCKNIDSRLYLDLVEEKMQIELNTVLKICTAFAGFNAAIVLKKFRG